MSCIQTPRLKLLACDKPMLEAVLNDDNALAELLNVRLADQVDHFWRAGISV